jgi:hypothetical protein
MFLDMINASSDQQDPFLNEELTEMFLAVKGVGGLRIHYTSRGSVNDAFAAPTVVESLAASTGDDESPTVTKDGLVIVFESSRNGNHDLWYATRADVTSKFSTPSLVPMINHPNRSDEGPFITADGCTLYFASDRGGGGRDIYVTSLLP